jgi:hypothetical protein
MEVLGIGLAAFIALKKKQERIVPGPAEFKAFDLRTLGHLYDAEKVLPARRLIGSDCMWPRPCPDGRAYEPPLMIQIPPRRPFVGSCSCRSSEFGHWQCTYLPANRSSQAFVQRHLKLQRRRSLLLAFFMTLFAADPIAGAQEQLAAYRHQIDSIDQRIEQEKTFCVPSGKNHQR